MISAQKALEKLMAGNKRFVADECIGSHTKQHRRNNLMTGQEPFAVILGCSDSRVPAEIIFDQGLGDLFVVRVAGNIVAPSQVGSIEFAVEQFGTPLVVVVGHSNCGAIGATLKALQNPGGDYSPNLNSIVDRICPHVETLVETDLKDKPEALLHFSIRANIRASVSQLKHGSHVLESLVNSGNLTVVGAHYSLETGEVEFLGALEDDEVG